MKKFLRRFAIILAILVGIGFASYNWFTKQMAIKPGTVEIFQGASVRQISDLLEIEGLVKNADFMYYYIKVKNKYYAYKELPEDEWYPIRFKHGKFTLEKGTIDDVVVYLNDGTNVVNDSIKVTIPEGKGIEHIGASLEKSGLFTQEEFFKVANDQKIYAQFQKTFPWLPPARNEKRYLLEGYLQANTYHFEKNSTPEMVIEAMLKETHTWMDAYVKSNTTLSFDEVLILASIVEAEGKFDEDRPKVAQVFLNRIAQKMPLQSDMTAAYANGKHKVFMYEKDIKIQSPYNTYAVKGLPIGPINSPSTLSFTATLYPAGSTFAYFYFYARPSGETFYTKTWTEHERIRQKYEHEWKKIEENT